MGEVIFLKPKLDTVEYDEYFGACPECEKTDGFMNIGSTHIFFCAEHKTCWEIGSNLFSAWRYETEEDWRKNAEVLSSYRTVEPIYPDQDPQAADAPNDDGAWPF